MISRQSLQFMRFPGRAGEPESFTALLKRAKGGHEARSELARVLSISFMPQKSERSAIA